MSLRVLIADDEMAARRGMSRALAKLDCDILEADNGEAALTMIREQLIDLVFLDLDMPELSGVGLLESLRDEASSPEIVVVTANDALESAIACMRLGASDYITKPFEVERLRAIARRNLDRVQNRARLDVLQRQLDDKTALGALLGVNRNMHELFSQIERAAPAPIDILIIGETGTGKELVAREIHRLSGRTGELVAVNSSAIISNLAESNLFGHVKGAFTGADADAKGAFERSHGGTLFLDEIGDMPLQLQVKVLRVLQERVVEPVGGGRTVPVDLRVISATHQDLEAGVREGVFREDLYYRIRGITLRVPPLRERPEDIVLLADYFLDRLAHATGGDVPRLSSTAVDKLLGHRWPGNVRELEQAVIAAATMTGGEQIGPGSLDLGPSTENRTAPAMESFFGLPLTEAKQGLVAAFEREAIERALTANDNNVSAAARQLGIHRQSLQQKMAQLGINRSP